MSAARSDSQAVMSIDQLAAYLQLPKSTLYKLVQEGKVPGRKLGRQWRFHRRAIDTWLSQGANEPAEMTR
jgi:excisionase family DNA binding protein